MKVLFGCLMCLVLTIAQTFAISGGPPYPGSTNVVGVFAGVMKPRIIPVDSPPGCSANSLGVFSVGVPDSGISSGTFVMFSQGRVFSGTIRGTADPGKATLKGVLNATVNFTVTQTFVNPVTGEVTTTTTQVTATANGNLDTKISTESSRSGLGATSTRLKGTATIDINHGELNPDLSPMVNCAMTLKVAGFKQTDTAPTTTSSG